MKIKREVMDENCRVYEKGEVVFNEGDVGEEMYIIIEGLVSISKKTTANSFKKLVSLKKGDMFGEMALVEKKRRSATAIVDEPAKLLILNESAFFTFLETNPSFSIKIIKVLADRLRGANKIIQQVMSTNLNKQIFEGLSIYAPEKGVSSYNGYRIKIDNFTEWVAQNLGIVKENVRPAINNFLLRGLVKNSALGESEIVVPKPPGAV